MRWGNYAVSLAKAAQINRKMHFFYKYFDIVPLETGGVLVGKTVKINIELEIVNQEETEKASAQD